MIRTTNEYVEFSITDQRDGEDLSGDTVTCALLSAGPPDGATTWLPCTFLNSFVDANGDTWYKFRTTSTVNFTTVAFPASYYRIYVKVVDSPETPIAVAGGITLDN